MHAPRFKQFQMTSALIPGDFDIDLADPSGGWCFAKFSVKITEKKVKEKSNTTHAACAEIVSVTTTFFLWHFTGFV